MKRLILIVLFLLPIPVYAQEQEAPLPDRWRGLVLDQSTPEDAIKVFGKPKKDVMTRLTSTAIQNWLSKKCKERVFRTLEFNKPEGVDKAFLSFLDNKLVAITIDVKKGISPAGLANIYGIPFQPAIGALDIAMRPRNYEQHQGQVYPRIFPTVYSMVAVSERSFVDAMVTNVPSFGGALARSMGIPDQPGSLPGKVEFISLISRTLENKDGADVLR